MRQMGHDARLDALTKQPTGKIDPVPHPTICLHVAGALLHRFVLRDQVTQRMMPW